MSDLSDFVDDAVLNWLLKKPMSLKELIEASNANPAHIRASLKRLLRAGKVRRFRRTRELVYSVEEGAREVGIP